MKYLQSVALSILLGVAFVESRGVEIGYLEAGMNFDETLVRQHEAILVALVTTWNPQPSFIREFHRAARTFNTQLLSEDVDVQTVVDHYDDDYRVAAALNVDSFPALRLLADNGTIYGIIRVYNHDELVECMHTISYNAWSTKPSSPSAAGVNSSESNDTGNSDESKNTCYRIRDFWPYPQHVWQALGGDGIVRPHWTTELLKIQLAFYFEMRKYLARIDVVSLWQTYVKPVLRSAYSQIGSTFTIVPSLLNSSFFMSLFDDYIVWFNNDDGGGDL